MVNSIQKYLAQIDINAKCEQTLMTHWPHPPNARHLLIQCAHENIKCISISLHNVAQHVLMTTERSYCVAFITAFR